MIIGAELLFINRSIDTKRWFNDLVVINLVHIIIANVIIYHDHNHHVFHDYYLKNKELF